MKEQAKKKKEEYELKFEQSVAKLDRRPWDEHKTESQRDREKEEYKDELQNQIRQKQMQESFKEQKKRLDEVEEEKRIKREVFELNNQFRIENGEDPLPLPAELQPQNSQTPYNFAHLPLNESIAPSVFEPQAPSSSPKP